MFLVCLLIGVVPMYDTVYYDFVWFRFRFSFLSWFVWFAAFSFSFSFRFGSFRFVSFFILNFVAFHLVSCRSAFRPVPSSPVPSFFLFNIFWYPFIRFILVLFFFKFFSLFLFFFILLSLFPFFFCFFPPYIISFHSVSFRFVLFYSVFLFFVFYFLFFYFIHHNKVVSLGNEQGVVSGYVHGAVGPSMGKNAALVALKLGKRTSVLEKRYINCTSMYICTLLVKLGKRRSVKNKKVYQLFKYVYNNMYIVYRSVCWCVQAYAFFMYVPVCIHICLCLIARMNTYIIHIIYICSCLYMSICIRVFAYISVFTYLCVYGRIFVRMLVFSHA